MALSNDNESGKTAMEDINTRHCQYESSNGKICGRETSLHFLCKFHFKQGAGTIILFSHGSRKHNRESSTGSRKSMR